jgi:glycosyltransferase involved in cell wall biosynthesis
LLCRAISLGFFHDRDYDPAGVESRTELIPFYLLLAKAVTEDGMRLLALVDSPNHVCCRYRIRAFQPALEQAGWSLVCQQLSHNPIFRAAQFSRVSTYDAVILQRKLLPSWQLAILRRHARHLVFDFDDAVLFRDSYDRRGPHSARRQRRFAATVRSADAVIAGNDFLADCALRAGAPAQRVHLIPTCIDPAVYADAGTTDRSAERNQGQIDLVWIGSASTLQGLEEQRDLWDLLGEEIPGLRLRVICDQFPRLRTLPVVPVPWSEAWEARDLMAGQIGISWLPDDLWSRGKCGLKVLQYQAAGLPVLANPVGLHTELIEPGITGFLPETPEQWISAVRALAADAELRRRLGLLARQRVDAGFSVAAWAETFVSAVRGASELVTEQPTPSSRLSSRAIPDPFYVRLRRMGAFGGSAQVGRFDGSSDQDRPLRMRP